MDEKELNSSDAEKSDFEIIEAYDSRWKKIGLEKKFSAINRTKSVFKHYYQGMNTDKP